MTSISAHIHMYTLGFLSLCWQEYYCAMMDQCPPMGDEEEVYQMLMHNFRRHYNTNRAPLGLYFHTIWFKVKHNMKGMKVGSRSE